jgi:acyl-CoA thioesterase
MTTVPAYFSAVPEGFAPEPASRSPWDASQISGVGMAGLLAHLIERERGEATFTVARLTIDILSVATREEVVVPRVTVRREGQRMRVLEAELIQGGRAFARASALLVRQTETPTAESGLSWPPPEAIDSVSYSANPELRNAVERRIVRGSPREAGPGAMWVRICAEMVAGVPLSPLVRAAMFGDFGSSIGSALDVREWTFANVDISLHFLREPRGEWLLIDALSESDGNGVSMVSSIFADRDGVYARGHQALFVNRRPTNV